MCRLMHYINKQHLVPIRLQLFKWGQISHFQSIFKFDFRWHLTLVWDPWPCQQVKVPMLYLWSKFDSNQTSNFLNEAKFHILRLKFWPQKTFDLNVTFGLVNTCGFPGCIYDLTLFETNQSMYKLEPNVNPNSQQTTTDCRGQSDPCVFPAKAGDTPPLHTHTHTKWLQFLGV